MLRLVVSSSEWCELKLSFLPHFVSSTNSGGTSSGFNTRPQGVKAYTNTSTLHSVAWLDDSTAILTTPVAPNIGFNATTTGIKTSCQSITTQCVDCTSYEPDTTMSCTGPEADILINCRGPALYNLSLGYPNPDASSYIGGILSPTTGNSNPGEVDTKYVPVIHSGSSISPLILKPLVLFHGAMSWTPMLTSMLDCL